MEDRNPGAAVVVVLVRWGVLVGFNRGGFGVMVKWIRGPVGYFLVGLVGLLLNSSF